MNAPFPDLASVLARCRRSVDDLMGGPLSTADWVGRAAEALLALDPSIRLALCHRTDGEPPPTAVRGGHGRSLPDPSEAVRSEILRLPGLDGTTHPSPALGAVFGLRCLAACLQDESGPWALLAVGTAKNASAQAVVVAEAVLTMYADALALGRRLESAERERDEFAGFALAGQAVSGLVHDLNNLLNSVVLQASVLQLQLEGKFHEPLDVIRRQVHQATGLLRSLGQVSGERAKEFYPVDLNRALHEVLGSDAALASRVQFSPPIVPLPPVRGTTGAFKQLLHLLLSAASADAPAALLVWADADEAGVQIVLEGSYLSEERPAGPTPSTDEALFWGRLGDLERLAGRSLLRQLSGALRVAPRPEGGVTLRVCWAAASGGEDRPTTQTPRPRHSS